MKKILFGLALGCTLTTFATDNLNCKVQESSGELNGATTATVTFYDGNNIIVDFEQAELDEVRITAEVVKENNSSLKITRRGPGAEKRVFELNKENGQVNITLKDDTFHGFGGEIYAAATMSCKKI